MTRAPRNVERRTWSSMIHRCRHNPHYVGLGIKVCPEWEADFEAFFAAVGPKPSDQHSIDRINTYGNYEPGNVRWATRIEQANNVTRNRRVVYRGTEMTLAEAIHLAGDLVPTKNASNRINLGWPVERAVEARLGKWGKEKRAGGRKNKYALVLFMWLAGRGLVTNEDDRRGLTPDDYRRLLDEHENRLLNRPQTGEGERLRAALARIAQPPSCGCRPCTGQCRSQEALQIEIDGMRETASCALAGGESQTS